MALCAIATAPLPAQQRPTFRANVELVQIDVVVLDKDGKPVVGLTKADFTLTDRRQPQSIDVFEEVSHSYATSSEPVLPADIPRDVSDNSTGRSDRLIVLAIDDMVPADRFDRIKALAKEVVAEVGQGASMALLTTSEARRVEVTDNRALLLDEIEKVGQRNAMAPRVPRMTSVETGSCGFGIFTQAAKVLGPEDARRKALIYISPYCGADLKEVVRIMSEHPDAAVTESTAAIHLIEELRRANVSFYAIDPRGVAPYSLGHFPAPDLVSSPRPASTGASGMTRSFDPVVRSQENLHAVTGATGGFAITNTDDFKKGLARLVDDFDHYYLLGFYPADRNGKGFRPVEVGALTLGYADANRKPATAMTMDPETLPFAPVLDRAFEPSDSLRVSCDVWRLDPSRPVATTLELFDERGALVTAKEDRIAAAAPGEAPPRLDVTFPLATFARGVYRLRATVADGPTSVTREMGFVVR